MEPGEIALISSVAALIGAVLTKGLDLLLDRTRATNKLSLTDREQLYQMMDEMRAEIKADRSLVASLLTENSKLSAQLSVVTQEHDRLHEDYVKLRDNQIALVRENAELREQTKEVDLLRKRVAELETEVASLRTKLKVDPSA